MGDWNCPECGFSNFATREVCLRCNPRERGEGDWDCPDCGAVVFAGKEECFRCAARARDGFDKGGGKGGGKGGKGKGGKAAAGGPATFANTIKSLQKFSPGFKQAWSTYCELYGEGWSDPSKHEDAYLSEFVEYVAGLAQADMTKEGGGEASAGAAKPAAAAAAPAGKKRAATQEAASAPPEKKKVTIKKAIATKIQELNASGTLLAQIRLAAVAASLSQLGEEEQIDCLTLLQEQAADIEDPNDYIKSQCQVLMTANGYSEEA